MKKLKFALKMLWAQRRNYYTIFMEQALITVALVISAVALAIGIEQHLRPGQLDVSNVYSISVHYKPIDKDTDAEIFFSKGDEGLEKLLEKIKEKDYVIGVNKTTSLLPYVQQGDEYYSDTLLIAGRKYKVKTKFVDQAALRTFDIKVTAGQWFESEEKLPDGTWPVLLSQQVVDAINGEEIHTNGEEWLGKKCIFQARPWSPQKELTVIGIVSGIKEQSFSSAPLTALISIKSHEHAGYTCTVKIKDGYEKEFYNDCTKELQLLGGSDYEILFTSLNQEEKLNRFDEMLKLTSITTPTLFFIVFAFLGTFGLFWMQSKKKAKQYALQIAIGLAPGQLVGNIVLESVLLSLFAAVPAVIIACFIYEWTWVHVIAIGCTLLIMMLFAVFSAWYPAYKVSLINPAEVLHYE